MKLIDKDALVAEIENLEKTYTKCPTRNSYEEGLKDGRLIGYKDALHKINTLEVKGGNLCNNGWIDCTKQMPPETKQTSDTLQGHREWTESDSVLVWDSIYGCSVDATKNGKWISEQRYGYTGQIVHGIIAWRPIPEFSVELLLKAQKGE